jgi:hypothetical protein
MWPAANGPFPNGAVHDLCFGLQGRKEGKGTNGGKVDGRLDLGGESGQNVVENRRGEKLLRRREIHICAL